MIFSGSGVQRPQDGGVDYVEPMGTVLADLYAGCYGSLLFVVCISK